MEHFKIYTLENLGTNPAHLMERLAQVRLDFLRSNRPTEDLRPVIQRAWLRSRISGVDPGLKRLKEFRPAQTSGEFLEAAEQVARLLGQLVQGVKAVAIVTDGSGTIVRVVGDLEVLRRLEAVQAVPEAVLGEEMAGANAVGTALEERVGVQMWAGEHFIEGFQPFTCTAVPVFHPLTRRVLGVVDVTTLASEFSESAASYLARWVQRSALEVEWDIYQRTLPEQQALLFHFITECRKRDRKYVVATDGEITIASRGASELLGPGDLGRLAGYAREVRGSRCPLSTQLVLSSGVAVQALVMPKWEGGKFIGAVISVKVLDEELGDGLRDLPAPLRELAGTNPALREALRTAAAAVIRRRALCICGEAGTGKYTLAHALASLLGVEPAVVDFGRLTLSELEGAVRQALQAHEMVILRHLEMLDPAGQELLAGVVAALRRPGQVLVTTLTHSTETGFEIRPRLAAVLADVVVRVPPLRERREDIPQIAERILKRHFGDTAFRLSDDALKLLVSARWPGNVRQLEEVLLATGVNMSGWLITGQHLRVDPPDPRSHRRAPLTPLEQAELAEISRALRQSRGNVSRAASMLGISRSTLHRKLKAYARLGYDLASGGGAV